MISQPSAFDEALSRPLVPREHHDNRSSHGSVSSLSSSSQAVAQNRARTFRRYQPPEAKASVNGSHGRGRDMRGVKIPPMSAFDASMAGNASLAGKGFGGGGALDTRSPTATASLSSDGESGTQFPGETAEEGRQTLEVEHVGTEIEEALVQERHSEFVRINHQMRHLSDIQQDLAVIVQEQQADIDAVEDNAIETLEKTERGLKHTERAWQLQRSGVCASRAFLIGLMCVAILVVIFVWLLQ